MNDATRIVGQRKGEPQDQPRKAGVPRQGRRGYKRGGTALSLVAVLYFGQLNDGYFFIPRFAEAEVVDSNGCEVVEISGQRVSSYGNVRQQLFANEFPTGWTVGSSGSGFAWFGKFITTGGDVVDVDWRPSNNGCS